MNRSLDCEVGSWGSWEGCSASCSPGGTQTRRRSVKTHPEFEGKTCPSLTDEQSCNTQSCPAGQSVSYQNNSSDSSPVDCVLAEGSWLSCSVSCGLGTRSRDRKMLTPDSNGGKNCTQVMDTGSTGRNIGPRKSPDGWGSYYRETQTCKLKDCPGMSLIVLPQSLSFSLQRLIKTKTSCSVLTFKIS